MGYIAVDEIESVLGQCRVYTDGGTGYEPRKNFHIKWHGMTAYPLVVDRFHVTYERDASKAYYFISRGSSLKYAGSRPNDGEVSRSFYNHLDPALLDDFDQLATTFLEAIKGKIGDSRSGITNEVQGRRHLVAKRQLKSKEWLQAYGEISAERQKMIDGGIPANEIPVPTKSEFRSAENVESLAESYFLQFEQSKKRKYAAPPTPAQAQVIPGAPSIVVPLPQTGPEKKKVKVETLTTS